MPSPSPPKLADKLLSWLCKPELLEEIQGDLYAYFQRALQQEGKRKATLKYWIQVLQFMRPFALKKTPTSFNYSMIAHHFKVAWRTFSTQKAYSAINIIGLAIGMACCLIILLYVQHELTFDQFHQDAHLIRRVVVDVKGGDGTLTHQIVTPGALKAALEAEIPEVEHATRLHPAFWGKGLLSNDTYTYYGEKFLFTDHSFFNVFSFQLRAGHAQSALSEPNSVVLTEDIAQRFFDKPEDALGQVLTFKILNYTKSLKVSGVVQNIPSQSHLQFDFLLPSLLIRPNWVNNWGTDRHMRTYIKHRAGASIPELDAKIHELLKEKAKVYEGTTQTWFTQALIGLEGVHMAPRHSELEPGGNRTYIKVLCTIALFILLVAGINYVNLATARSAIRAKEIGIRKISGAFRRSLVAQFLIESLVIAFLAGIVAVITSQAVLPYFNHLMQIDLSLGNINSSAWILMVGIIGAVGITAGLYPALYLSGFSPVASFRKHLSGKPKGLGMRKVLVVSQFGLSAFLVVGMIVVQRQMQHVQSVDLGFDKEQILMINNFQVTPNRDRSFTVRKKLESLPSVIQVGGFIDLPIGMLGGLRPHGMKLKESVQEPIPSIAMLIDSNYLEVIGLEFVEGHNFSSALRSELDNGAIINETAAKQLGIEGSALGQKLDAPWNNSFMTIIGVVKDFHAASLHHEILPIRFSYNSQAWQVAVKISGREIPETLEQIETIWKQFVPDAPLDYYFMDEALNDLYKDELNFQSLLSIMTALALAIAALGLLGLVAFMTQQRTKEVGIRKVLGASIASLFSLLSKEYLILIALANLLAWPVAYHIMDNWLENFAYHVNIDWSVFLISGSLALLVALMTVSIHTYKTAISNTVDSLRHE